MTRTTLGLLASGAALVFAAACAGGPRVTTRYPLALSSATVVNGGEHALAVDHGTVADGPVRIAVRANQAGMIFTVENQAGEAGTIVWDDAALIRDDGAPRRLKVGAQARVNAAPDGVVNYMKVSGPLFRQHLPASGTVVAYAPGQARIPSPEKGCASIMGTEFHVLLPVQTEQGVRRYTLTFRPAWFESFVTTGLQRCGPVPAVAP